MAAVQTPSLINEEYFKKYSPIPNNFDISEIRSFFNVAEQLWVIPIIGQSLYDELIQQICEQNITPENSTLLLIIYPYLSFSICYEALPFIAYHFSQVGVTKGKSDNSDSVSINDVNYISTTLRSQIETMKKNVKAFLDRNKDSYPLYKEDDTIAKYSDCSCDDVQWINEFYSFGRYDYLYFKALYNANKNRPNPRLQVFTTPRRPIDIE